jgi:nucleoid-associated protein YgaU
MDLSDFAKLYKWRDRLDRTQDAASRVEGVATAGSTLLALATLPNDARENLEYARDHWRAWVDFRAEARGEEPLWSPLEPEDDEPWDGEPWDGEPWDEP